MTNERGPGIHRGSLGLDRSCARAGAGGVLAACAACARGAALEGAAFFFTHAAPHAGVLVVVDGPLQADAYDLALAAHGLGLGDLRNSRTRVPDGEEKVPGLRSGMLPYCANP